MSSESAVDFSFEEAVKSILLGSTNMTGQTLYVDLAGRSLTNGEVLVLVHQALGAMARNLGKQISDLIVVELGVTDADRDVLFELGVRQRVDLINGSWHDTTVLEAQVAVASHGVSLSSTSLAVAEDGTVVSVDDRLDDVRS